VVTEPSRGGSGTERMTEGCIEGEDKVRQEHGRSFERTHAGGAGPPVGAQNYSHAMSLTFSRSSADRTAHDF
jgi:hypothetical protein